MSASVLPIGDVERFGAEPGRMQNPRAQGEAPILLITQFGVDPAEQRFGVRPAIRADHRVGTADIRADSDVGQRHLAARAFDLPSQAIAEVDGCPITSASLRYCWRFANLSAHLLSLVPVGIATMTKRIGRGMHDYLTFGLVRTRFDGKPQTGITFLLIDMHAPGVGVRPIVTLEFERGGQFAPGLKVRLQRLRGLARETLGPGDGVWRRLAEVDVAVDAIEIAEHRVMSALSSGRNPGPMSSMLKTQGTETMQLIEVIAVELAGPYAAVDQPEARGPGSNQPPIGPDDQAEAMAAISMAGKRRSTADRTKSSAA